MKNKTKKVMAFLASMTMVVTASSVLPYSNLNIIAQAEGEENDKTNPEDEGEGDEGDEDEGDEGDEDEGDEDEGDEGGDNTNTAKVAGVSLSLSGKIGLNIYVENYSKGNKVKIDGEDATGTEKDVNGTKYQVFTKEFAPKDYKNKVSITVGDGIVVEWSIADYTENVANYLTEKDKALVKAMESYCEAAAEYFGDKERGNSNAKTNKPNDAKYYASSLILNSGITVRTYYVVKNESNDAETTAEYYYVDNNDVTISGLLDAKFDNNGTVSTYITKLKENDKVKALVEALEAYADAAKTYNNK